MGNVVDKKGVLLTLSSGTGVVLELGCGKQKREDDAIGIDLIDSDSVDIVGDALDVLKAIPASSVAAIYSYHFLEHTDDLASLMKEVSRVLVAGGVFEAVVPHFSNPYYYSDPTHRTYFGLYTFSYLAVDRIFKRSVPEYVRSPDFELVEVDLIFKSQRPFYVRYLVKRFIGAIMNSSVFFREFYEENLTYIFPCFEIRYYLRKVGCE